MNHIICVIVKTLLMAIPPYTAKGEYLNCLLQKQMLAFGFAEQVLFCKAKRQHLFISEVSRYCLLALHGGIRPVTLVDVSDNEQFARHRTTGPSVSHWCEYIYCREIAPVDSTRVHVHYRCTHTNAILKAQCIEQPRSDSQQTG